MLPLEALEKYYGYKSFRPMQADIVKSVLDGHDTLVLMPTGGGKSITFQIPALVKPGFALVLSPLIALMKDQVEGLRQNGVKAAFLNSTQSLSAQEDVLRACANGEIKLLYTSPERLSQEGFQQFLRRQQLSLIAIDEAHCISFWGHDFRPEYTQLKFLKTTYAGVPIIALTATADKLTRQDIVNQLGLVAPNVFLSSFDRPNLRLDVRPGLDRVNEILKILDKKKGQSGIIYCLSRKSCEELAAKLRDKGYNVGHYHAAMPAQERALTQERFLKDDLQIICATIAFGMGIDKSNVRFVIHYNLPKSMESYYQEIGRAGRDGQPADTILFYSMGDAITYRKMIMEEESNQQELKLSKLERLTQYAEGHFCRRQVLLAYFNESLEKPCGNCDVCSTPRKTFDGTVVAQKALSAVARTQQKANTQTIIDILRGMKHAGITSKGYDQLKTYGAGREFDPKQWFSYINQMVNLGLLEIAYDQGNVLQLTERSKAVLFDNQTVQLIKTEVATATNAAAREVARPKTVAEVLSEELGQELRNLRKRLADQQGIPAYQVFSDATLQDMASKRPVTREQMQDISGMSVQKLAMYGTEFMEAIVEFYVQRKKNIPGQTHLITWHYYQKNQTPAQIAHSREMSEDTVLGHLLKLHDEGYLVEWDKVISKEELLEIKKLFETVAHEPNQHKPILEACGYKYGYGKVKVAAGLLGLV